MTNNPESFERSVMRSSVIPSLKYSCSGSPLMLTKGSTAMEGLSGAVGVEAPTSICTRYTCTGLAIFLTVCSPRYSYPRASLVSTWS